jgi:NADH:ubiquinone oxidoreductase subunit 6 (subunit J)
MEKKVTSPVAKGLIISLILIVVGLAVYFTDQMANKALGWVQYLLFMGAIVWACISYAKDMNANVSFGNVFAHGFKTTAVVIVIMAIYTLLATKVLFPEMVDKGIDQARAEMESQAKLSDSDIDNALSMTRKYFVPIAMGAIVLMFGLLGCIASLIGAAAAKKNPQTPFNQ